MILVVSMDKGLINFCLTQCCLSFLYSQLWRLKFFVCTQNKYNTFTSSGRFSMVCCIMLYLWPRGQPPLVVKEQPLPHWWEIKQQKLTFVGTTLTFFGVFPFLSLSLLPYLYIPYYLRVKPVADGSDITDGKKFQKTFNTRCNYPDWWAKIIYSEPKPLL